MRQALAGMLWSKQFYYLDADQWLEEHFAHPLHSGSREFRNREGFTWSIATSFRCRTNGNIPGYAAWDLAFHTLPISIVDPDFAKQQMKLMFHGYYLHPSDQIRPMVELQRRQSARSCLGHPVSAPDRAGPARRGDIDFLKSAFNKLLLNFTWWVNRKDRFGKNVFEGGFLGLDNIGVFDRSAPCRRAVTSNRQTAPRGWPCSVRTCSKSP